MSRCCSAFLNNALRDSKYLMSIFIATLSAHSARSSRFSALAILLFFSLVDFDIEFRCCLTTVLELLSMLELDVYFFGNEICCEKIQLCPYYKKYERLIFSFCSGKRRVMRVLGKVNLQNTCRCGNVAYTSLCKHSTLLYCHTLDGKISLSLFFMFYTLNFIQF